MSDRNPGAAGAWAALSWVGDVERAQPRPALAGADAGGNCWPGWCRRHSSRTSVSIPKWPIPMSRRSRRLPPCVPVRPAAGAGRRPRAGCADAVRRRNRVRASTRRFRSGQDPPVGCAQARASRSEVLRHLGRIHQPDRGALVSRTRCRPSPAIGWCASTSSNRRSRRHGVDVDVSGSAGRGGRPAGGNEQHTAGSAGRGPVRRRGLPLRRSRPFGALRGGSHRRRGLPPPWCGGRPRSHRRRPARSAATTLDAAIDDFDALLVHLSDVHPSKYAALVRRLVAVPGGVHQVTDQAQARGWPGVDRPALRPASCRCRGIPGMRSPTSSCGTVARGGIGRSTTGAVGWGRWRSGSSDRQKRPMTSLQLSGSARSSTWASGPPASPRRFPTSGWKRAPPQKPRRCPSARFCTSNAADNK